MTTNRRRAAVAGAVLASVLGISAPALAVVKGQTASGSQKATTVSWGAAGSSTSAAPTIGSPYTMTWQGLGATTQYFEIDNTGTIDLSGETYTTTNSPQKVVGGAAPAVTLTACIGANWNTNTGKCAGTTTVLDTSASGATTAIAAIPTGGTLSVRATTSLNVFGFTTSVSVSTDRTQIRSAITTNS